MTPKLTDGARLRRSMNAALEAAGKALGTTIQWDQSELISLDRATQAADRAEQLRAQYEIELNGQARSTALARLSAEIRALDRLTIEITRRLDTGLKRITAKPNPHKQRAAHYRWNRQQQQEA
jgi:hypothetical protein